MCILRSPLHNYMYYICVQNVVLGLSLYRGRGFKAPLERKHAISVNYLFHIFIIQEYLKFSFKNSIESILKCNFRECLCLFIEGVGFSHGFNTNLHFKLTICITYLKMFIILIKISIDNILKTILVQTRTQHIQLLFCVYSEQEKIAYP